MSEGGGVVIPILRYQDAAAAIKWLCAAFGFQEHLVVADEENPKIIHHAQLVYGTGMVMLSSAGISDASISDFDNFLDKNQKQNIYMIVPSADDHYAQAKKSGAEILLDITDQDYGGRGYTCRDVEGNIWSFGDYNSWH